jgi:hypothetical protein
MPLHLVPDDHSRDTVEVLTQLSVAASDGDVQGIAFVAFLRGNRYIANVAGRCMREATHTRGALMALDDKLSELVHGREPDETR